MKTFSLVTFVIVAALIISTCDYTQAEIVRMMLYAVGGTIGLVCLVQGWEWLGRQN